MIIIDSNDLYEFKIDKSKSSLYSSIFSNLVPLNVAMKTTNEKSERLVSPQAAAKVVKKPKVTKETNNDNKVKQVSKDTNKPISEIVEEPMSDETENNTSAIIKMESITDDKQSQPEKSELSIPLEDHSSNASIKSISSTSDSPTEKFYDKITLNPPPESLVGTESRELQLGLVRYSLKISSVLSSENYTNYLKSVLTYKCLSGNRLGNVSTTGSCEFYYRNVKYSVPILYSYRTSDYYDTILKVRVFSCHNA